MKYKSLVSMTLLFCMILLLNGCTEEMRTQLESMREFSDKVTKEYDHKNINFKINDNNSLVVNFINSPFNDLSRKEKNVKASEIALFTLSALEKDTEIEKISVVFTIYEKKYLLIDYTNSLSTFVFDVAELRKYLDAKQPKT